MTLSGLAAGTTYYYQVNSTDSKGNHGHGGNGFKTAGFRMSGMINPTAAGNGATVALSGAANAATTADSSGNYTFAGLPNGSYMVTPNHTGYSFTPGNQSATVNGADVTGVNFTATAQTFSISGTISPAAGGSGATVTLSGAASAATIERSRECRDNRQQFRSVHAHWIGERSLHHNSEQRRLHLYSAESECDCERGQHYRSELHR